MFKLVKMTSLNPSKSSGLFLSNHLYWFDVILTYPYYVVFIIIREQEKSRDISLKIHSFSLVLQGFLQF